MNNFASALATEAQIAERVRKQRATASALPAATVADGLCRMAARTAARWTWASRPCLRKLRPAMSLLSMLPSQQRSPAGPHRAQASRRLLRVAPSRPRCQTCRRRTTHGPRLWRPRQKQRSSKGAAAQRKSKDLQKAEKFMDAKAKLLSDALWETKPKARPINTAASTMEDLASSLLGDESASQLMNQMLELSDHAPKKLEVFTRLRKEYKSACSSACGHKIWIRLRP